MANKVKYTFVRAGKAMLPGRSLWETHPDHPHTEEFPLGGEIFVAHDIPKMVALTPTVTKAIRDELIEEVPQAEAIGHPKFHEPIDPNKGDQTVTVAKALNPVDTGATVGGKDLEPDGDEEKGDDNNPESQ